MITWNVGKETIVIQELNLQDITINWEAKAVRITYSADRGKKHGEAWRLFSGVDKAELINLAGKLGIMSIPFIDTANYIEPEIINKPFPKTDSQPDSQPDSKPEAESKEKIQGNVQVMPIRLV